jgi:hypothetical protein
MKVPGGVEVHIPVFMTSALVEVSGQLHASAALPPGKVFRYPLDRRLGGPQSRYGEGNILDPTGTRTPNPRSSSTT